MNSAPDVFQLDAHQTKWVEQTLNSLSLREKMGQILNVSFGWGKKDISFLLEQIEKFQLGSGLGGGCAWRESRDLHEKINQRLKIPMLFNADAEAGLNITGATPLPTGMGRAAIGSLEEAEKYAYDAGRITAIQGKSLGIYWNLAPVVDINANFRNPITNLRSAGDNVERVKRLTASFIKGMQDFGMAGCAKHFPGDGYSDLDQHKLTTVNPLSRKDWYEKSGGVFQHVINEGVYTIMPGHIACPGLVDERNPRGRPVPATLSRKLLTDVLRGELGFKGLVVSDALGMGGIQEHIEAFVDAVVRTLWAGSDIALLVPLTELENIVVAIEKSLIDKVMTEDDIHEKAKRVLQLKAKLNLHQVEQLILPEKEAITLFEPRLDEKEALAYAEKTITLTHDIENIFPLDASKLKRVRINVLNEEQFWGEDNIKLFGNTIEKLQLVEELEKRGIKVDVFQDPGEYSTYATFDQYDAFFYLFNNGPQASRCSIAPCRQALREVDWRVINSKKPVVFVALRSPYLPYYLPGIPNCICTYQNSDVMQTAVAKAIFGEIPFQGTLPVIMPSEENAGLHL